jgi:hypothetical protein
MGAEGILRRERREAEDRDCYVTRASTLVAVHTAINPTRDPSMRSSLSLLLCLMFLCVPASAADPNEDPLRIAATVAEYCAAWSEPDPVKRMNLLKKSWSDKGSYTDPTAYVEGRDTLHQHIGRFFEQFPGAKIVPSSGVDLHHGKIRFAWRMVVADGSTALEGMDYGEIDEAGMIRRIVGFFGPLPAKP